jgi:hypothetical protein
MWNVSWHLPTTYYFCIWERVWISTFALPFPDADGHVVPYDCPDLTHILFATFLGATGLPSSMTSVMTSLPSITLVRPRGFWRFIDPEG